MADDWPLDNIAQLHGSNDVLILPMENNSQSHGSTSNTIPSLSILAGVDDHHNRGNQRLLVQLQDRLEEYKVKSRLEKPLVAVEILQWWRSQTPPGRFLISQCQDDDNNNKNNRLLSWKDVGDKRARSYISKALKQLTANLTASGNCRHSRSNTNSNDESEDCFLVSAVNPNINVSAMEITENEEKKDPDVVGADDKAILTAVPTMVIPDVALPRLKRPERSSNTRRISEALHAVRARGKLYGRVDEQTVLFETLQQMRENSSFSTSSSSLGTETVKEQVHLILIKGPIGVGKTALARTLKKPTFTNREMTIPAFFMEGKFEHLGDANPYKPFIDAVTDFCHQVLLSEAVDSGVRLQQYRDVIANTLQDDTEALLNLIPALGALLQRTNTDNSERAIDNFDDDEHKSSLPQAKQNHTPGVLARQKTKSLYVNLLQAIASVDSNPLVVLFEDLHWANETSLDFFGSVLSDIDTSAKVLFLASMRDETTGKRNPYPNYLNAMERRGGHPSVQVHNITLGGLNDTDVQDLLVDTLQSNNEQMLSLSALVYALTQGNPMFILELLRILQDQGLLFLDKSSALWEYDIQEIQSSFQNINNVLDLFKKLVQDLPAGVQKTLFTASCLGSTQIDESILAMLDTDDLASCLARATSAGLLRQRNEKYYFASDGVQHAIYNLIPTDERASNHLEIGQKIWINLEDRKDEEFLRVLLNQLLKGVDLLKEDHDLHSVASLCLLAGEKAVRSSGFQTAWFYLYHGISLLPKQRMWNRDNYDLCLRLHNCAIEVCYCNADFDTLDRLVNAILENSRVFDDSLIARCTQIYALGSRERLSEALDSGLRTLQDLGENFTLNPSSFRLAYDMWKTRKSLSGKSDEYLLRMRRMSDRRKLAAMQILNHMYLYALYSKPPLAAFIAFRMVQITKKFGLCAISSVAFAYYALSISGCDLIEEGYRYAELSLKLYDKFQCEPWLCRVYTLCYGTVFCWGRPLSSTLAPLQDAYNVGLRTGDLEYAMLNGSCFCWNNHDLMSLPVLEGHLRKLSKTMEVSGHTLALSTLQPLMQLTQNFVAGPGKVERREEFLDFVQQGIKRAEGCSNEGCIRWMRAVVMVTAYIYKDYDLAEEYSTGAHELYGRHTYCGIGASFILFFECMASLAQARKRFSIRRLHYVRGRLRRLQKWAQMTPDNLLDTLHLLEGEFASVMGDHEKASINYRAAILHSRNRGSLLREALGNERFAYHLLESDKKTAEPFMKEAVRLFDEWGAPAKTFQVQKILTSVYPDLKDPSSRSGTGFRGS